MMLKKLLCYYPYLALLTVILIICGCGSKKYSFIGHWAYVAASGKVTFGKMYRCDSSYPPTGREMLYFPAGACCVDSMDENSCYPDENGVAINYSPSGECSIKATYKDTYDNSYLFADNMDALSTTKKIPVSSKSSFYVNINQGAESGSVDFDSFHKVTAWERYWWEGSRKYGEIWDYANPTGHLSYRRTVDAKVTDGFERREKDSNIYIQYANGVALKTTKLPIGSNVAKPLSEHDQLVINQALRLVDAQYARFEKDLGIPIPRDCSIVLAHMKKHGE